MLVMLLMVTCAIATATTPAAAASDTIGITDSPAGNTTSIIPSARRVASQWLHYISRRDWMAATKLFAPYGYIHAISISNNRCHPRTHLRRYGARCSELIYRTDVSYAGVWQGPHGVQRFFEIVYHQPYTAVFRDIRLDGMHMHDI